MKISSLVTASVAVVATACGSGQDVTIIPVDSSSPEIQMLTAAATSTAELDSGRVRLESGATIDGGSVLVGESDGEADAFGMTVDGAFAGDDVSFELAVTGMFSMFGDAGAAESGDESDVGLGFEGRVVDGVAFMRTDDVQNGQWVRLPEDDLDGGSFIGDGEFVDVGELITVPEDLLEGADGDVENLGTEEVLGGRATHYRLTISNEAFDGSDLSSEFSFGAETDVPVDLWVNDAGQMVRFDASTESAGFTSNISMDFYDLGADIVIEAPDGAVDFDETLVGDLFSDDMTGAGDVGSFPADSADSADLDDSIDPESVDEVVDADAVIDPAVVVRLPGVVEEILVEVENMTPTERDAYIDFRVLELAGDNPEATQAIRDLIDVMVAASA